MKHYERNLLFQSTWVVTNPVCRSTDYILRTFDHSEILLRVQKELSDNDFFRKVPVIFTLAHP